MHYSLSGLAFLLIICCSACYESVPEADNDIPLSKMAEVIADLHVAESALSELPMGPKRDSTSAAYYLQVFDMYGVKAEDFDRNLKVILRDPNKSLEMYTLALEVLETQQAELQK